ncbi:hypothetical protein VC83_04817 [Pseudogymnoascus destructans]|uniref:Core Histone H2A/H2B/H3 domain-containing protein n=2 Tax=Pseudogymnoascus destructans TaxID=655981 RepID=L8FRT9_PSED2|nr:uncharacterized protein VC83_04817 [Pseudogymnoascus destructans]ELR03178.1 hypothetical protein GMDG_06004 [Pseudogymnoascus destructans 20631-21]OAF57253.1 hypothetical protein VC83_04817 [Pseudogymnoascus destructans]
MDDEPYDDADPVTSSSDSETEDGIRAPHIGPKFLRSSQRQQQLLSPLATQPKAPRGPIPTLAPGQVLSQKVPKLSSMACQKQARATTARKALRKAPVGGKTGGKTVLKPKRRFKPGVVALRQIKQYQKTTEPLIPPSAVSALQEAAETTLVKEFEMTQLAAIHAKRVTIQQKDMKLVQLMRLHMTGYRFPG